MFGWKAPLWLQNTYIPCFLACTRHTGSISCSWLFSLCSCLDDRAPGLCWFRTYGQSCIPADSLIAGTLPRKGGIPHIPTGKVSVCVQGFHFWNKRLPRSTIYSGPESSAWTGDACSYSQSNPGQSYTLINTFISIALFWSSPCVYHRHVLRIPGQRPTVCPFNRCLMGMWYTRQSDLPGCHEKLHLLMSVPLLKGQDITPPPPQACW